MRDLETVRARLLGLEAALPESPAERGLGDLEATDDATELRSVIRCVLEDMIRPAIEDLQDAGEGSNPLGLAEQFELVVKVTGRVVLPQEVRAALGLQPGDLFSMVKNAISVRLASYRELVGDWQAESPPNPPNRWRFLEDFLRRTQTWVEPDGTMEIPPDLLALAEGDRLVLEVVKHGQSHDLFLYRVEGPPARS